MILIEGLNLAGKSTLIEGLRHHFPRTRVLQGHFCANNPAARVARELARWDEGFGGLEAGSLFLSTMLWDARNYQPPAPGEVHLQNSCWLRTLAYEQLYGSVPIARMMEEQGRRFPRFEKAFFLTASLEERERRLRARPERLDLMAFRQPEKFLALERRLRELVVEWEAGVVVETDGLAPNQVLRRVLNKFMAKSA
jgi:thymidylate kinase